jgi:hypothetical protein
VSSQAADPGDGAPNSKYVTVKFEVPREPAAYTATTHFRQRLNGRKDPELKTWILEECIEEGRLRGVGDIDVRGPDLDETTATFAFDREIWSQGTHQWRVVVGIVPKAFAEDDVHHRVITAFCRCHSDDQQEVSD